MKIEIVSSDKNNLEVKLDNLTVAELLRVYLNENGADFVAWRRDHPSSPALLKIKTSDKTVKKTVGDAIDSVKKDCEKILSVLKK